MAPRFTRGSTFGHVASMTATGAIGLISLFMVDAANLFYISLLGAKELAAAVGFAGTVQFFLISVSIGLAIGATALCSRAIGAGQAEEARHLAASALVTLVTALGLVAAGVWIFREEALALLGAEGETLAIASRFLAIVLPAMPVLGIAMVTSGLLRAAGEGRRAMYVTLSGGVFGASLDPVFIFALDLGVDGAAIVSVMSRLVVAGVGLWLAGRVHGLIGGLDLARLPGHVRAIGAIALPAVATQLSTPFGNAYLTTVVAAHGDEAVAGWAVVGRLSAVAFGGIFALSGAVGPIFGQNLGAGLMDRVARAYRDALIFALLYVGVAWAILWVSTGAIVAGFGLEGAGAEVIRAFTHYGAGFFAFTAALFVSNAAFNNLGRPGFATACNWSRDAAAIPLIAALIGGALGAEGAVAIQSAAAALVGTGAAVLAGRYTARLRATKAREAAEAALPSPLPAFATAAPGPVGSERERSAEAS